MRVSFLTLNLRFGLANDGENSWENRKAAVESLLDAHRPDFLAVQEANVFQAGFLAEVLPGYLVTGVRPDAPRFWQNNVIYSASGWNLSSFLHFYLSATPEIPSRFAESRWPRQCTIGCYERDGREMVIGDTHFDFAECVQTRSAGLIMDKLSGYSCPTVLMGDFNARPLSPCYRVFTASGEKCDRPLTDVFDQSDPDFNSGTHHGFTGSADPDKGRIDWIFQRGFSGVAEKAIIRDSFEGRYPSDHFPVKAVLEI
ncbi:MAG: endonuclease/exonuclease/phosphatase family protein [Deltaproteobacteria bacterium]|nr:endonuclease/exonuclease/phosphatase family protein [Deltaproteobacteria bacterium]